MLNNNVHLGHQVRKWNPKMSSFIYGERNGIHIIDILQTIICLQKASNFLYKVSKENKTTKILGNKCILSYSCAINSNSYYVTQRWLGGMLTNWITIKNCIENLKLLLNEIKNLIYRLEKYLSGIKNMTKVPDVVILVGQNKEINAVKECIKLGITTITIVDTNCDPTLTNFVIPANDDSISSISLILNELSKSISKNFSTLNITINNK
uniref:ribosomal protein S2 n=1 Tax=Phacus arnoldii TaxID=298292 RepID=UPI0023AA3F90|nr:ribosomal protein S2 [Phacus arnoldii]WCH63544.1 ribosomal protein S2 [Phacus arnoldii]